MKKKIEQCLDKVTDHYYVVLLFLSLVALTFTGVGSRRMVGLIGCVLCATAFTKGSVAIDPWVAVALAVYELFSALSSMHTYGSVFYGFFNTQLIFLAMYLLMAYLEDGERIWLRRLSVLWAAYVAVIGIFQFAQSAVTGSVSRLGIVLGNPNALGCFLVLAWFALKDSEPDIGETGITVNILQRAEPLILTGLVLTLSMGNFLAMAVGVFVFLLQKGQVCTRRERFSLWFRTAAEIILGIAPGILMYFAAKMTDTPWLCSMIVLYLIALTIYWPLLDRFFRIHKWTTLLIALMGLCLAAVVVMLRSNASATFIERLQMMRNGLGYLLRNPLFGVGPYKWRGLNKADGDIYFNTYHIHNSLIHVGVEIGCIAMAMLAAIIIRRCRKGRNGLAGFIAFVIHNMLDVSFFYVGITTLALLTTARPREKSCVISRPVACIIFVFLFAVFVYTGFHDAF